MYAMATDHGYYEYHLQKPTKQYSKHSTKPHKQSKPSRGHMKNASYRKPNHFNTWHDSHDSSDSTSATDPHNHCSSHIHTHEDDNNASSDTDTFDTPTKNIIIRIDTVEDDDPSDKRNKNRLAFARNTSKTSSSSSSSSCSASSSSCTSSSATSSSSCTSSSSSSSCCESSSSETTFISFPDEEEENGRVREKLLMHMECGGVASPYSVAKKRSLSTNHTLSVTNNSHFLAVTPIQAGSSRSRHEPHLSQSINHSMMVSPSSNTTDAVNINAESTVSPMQKFIFKFSDKDVVPQNRDKVPHIMNDHINPFRIHLGNGKAKQSISASASTNTKVKINALAHKVEILTNKMNDMEQEWQHKERIYRDKIAKLNKNKKKAKTPQGAIDCSEIEHMKRAEDEKEDERLSEQFGLDVAYNLAEALHHKHKEHEEMKKQSKLNAEYAIAFYKSFCPSWLNERWIRVMFLWTIMIWMLSNIVITIKVIINYYHQHSTADDSIIIIWKLYILSTIYVWLEIFFILSLSIVSIYWKNKYFVHNPRENTWIRIVLMSIGAIVLLCNLSGTVFKLLSDGNWIKMMIGAEYQNIIKYINYFMINVLSILIAVVCVAMIIRRLFHKNYNTNKYEEMFYVARENMRCCNHALILKCVCCILICDIFIFIESMYTFNDSFNDAWLQPLLTICVDSLLIFLCAFMIHRILMYHYVDRIIALRRVHRDDNISHSNVLLLSEYKRITFYDSFQLIVCLSPIADLITDSWTIYIYFVTPNESFYAWCALFILFLSFRFHIALWLLLKRRNETFLFSSKIMIWLCWLLPFVSLCTNCLIHGDDSFSVILILLSITNEIILFFAPVFAPVIIIYQAAKDFIITFILIKFKHLQNNEVRQVPPLLDMTNIFDDTNSYMRQVNDVLADDYQLQSNNKQTHRIVRIRGLKRIGAALPMFILQSYVIMHQDYLANNAFRVTQYAISATSSFLIVIHAICWYYRNRM
eukprot:165338_1